jgi:hypothetical protein
VSLPAVQLGRPFCVEASAVQAGLQATSLLVLSVNMSFTILLGTLFAMLAWGA